MLATPGNASIEEIAAIAPDVFWFQLYRFPYDDHAITFDLVRRADEAGAHVLVPTVDCAGKSKRPRDIRNGARVPFPINPWTTYQVLTSPAWTMQLLRNGMPITANLVPYAEKATQNATAEVMQLRSGGSHTWEELKRLRDKWKRPLVLKGILHPEDAERAVAMGADGIWVSNHGGRHFDGAPASIDVLPAIVSAVGSRVPVMIDSGIRGGLDVVRALALGAKFCFTGRCFAYGLGALGPAGAPHVVDLFMDEIKTEMLHVGARTVAEAANITRAPSRRVAVRQLLSALARVSVFRRHRHAAADRGDDERDLLAQHRQRNGLQLLFEAEPDQAMHRREQRAREQRAPLRRSVWLQDRATAPRHVGTGAAVPCDTSSGTSRPGIRGRTARASAGALAVGESRDRRARGAPVARWRSRPCP